MSQGGWIPTVFGGWDRRISGRTNLILQASISESTVQDTEIDELSATKIQATNAAYADRRRS